MNTIRNVYVVLFLRALVPGGDRLASRLSQMQARNNSVQSDIDTCRCYQVQVSSIQTSEETQLYINLVERLTWDLNSYKFKCESAQQISQQSAHLIVRCVQD